MNVAVVILFILLCTKLLRKLLEKASKHLVSLVVRKTSETTRLRRDVEELKKKLADVSAQDEFAYHARLQRKLNKVTEDFKTSTSNDQTFAWKTRLVMKGTIMVSMFLTHVAVVWWFWTDIVLSVPANFLYPMDGLLAYPVGKSGDVGAPAWVLLSSHALEFTFCLLNHSRQQLSTSQVKTKS
ncbi:guided entry of tail-anchored proteins factor 1-like [Corticium candelabrum]|uniref:guided entry of tail-anchored proteins factor 1-like n=1 Tax=Corticium candelabrum TaxID=121492 RepID=UPI002E2640CF|nr:guided entry of tail-anchored proteins factor 1-like [Corticium candelabrum]